MYGAFPLTPTRARVGSSATSKSRPRAPGGARTYTDDRVERLLPLVRDASAREDVRAPRGRRESVHARARVTTDRPTDGDAALGYVYR